MARTRNVHNHHRHSAELDSAPSRLEELTFHSRLEEQERVAAGWRRNMMWASLAIVAMAAAYYFLR
jgi:hypothetical protein